MGVYIENMEMPGMGFREIRIHPNGTATECLDGYEVNVGKAISVPAHGDLIDRGEAIIDANERAYDFWLSDDEVNATIQFLNEQTTIISAEEGET